MLLCSPSNFNDHRDLKYSELILASFQIPYMHNLQCPDLLNISSNYLKRDTRDTRNQIKGTLHYISN